MQHVARGSMSFNSVIAPVKATDRSVLNSKIKKVENRVFSILLKDKKGDRFIVLFKI